MDENGNTNCFLSLQNESVLIQKIYTHFKKAPGTHKLGVLYVVDSVTRQWVDAARKAGQPSGSAAPDGTFAAGVNRVTELLPVLMTDIINNAPDDQKVRFRCNMQRLPSQWVCGHIRPYKTFYVYPANTLKRIRAVALVTNSSTYVLLPILGENQKTRRHLGARLHLSCPHACVFQTEAQRTRK
jgi:hypothetical protein